MSVNCQNPKDQVNDSVTIMGYGEPGIRDTNVTFTCPPGLVLTGPSQSTCMGNGEWEPDPREAQCKGENKQCHEIPTSILIHVPSLTNI